VFAEAAKRLAHVAWRNKAVPVVQASQPENAASEIKRLLHRRF